ncbi:ComEA family DNA-binding protein [Pollutimonas bauzanensis]|uniref:Competence protein ComEA n=1 Tax=Pollutimonas bauzanensis TaxID=658167 RepID=A0A1M5NBF8_9BURK|nr:DUF655 domain-containing protein [Pollutimonas bauzanensis]SHG86815.1 competence protein ComEA [Pollutimonas bauzanensis]
MNPFTESTVAHPLARGASPRAAGAPGAGGRKKRRSLVGWALGAMGLATSLGLPQAGALPAGALLARAGMLASVVAPGAAHAIDVNSATQEQLESVRGIGPKTAQTIIDERARGGRYESFADLSERVKGIGPKKAVSLQAAGLTLGGQGAGKPPDPSQDATASGGSGARLEPGGADAARKPGRTGAAPRALKKSP